MKYTIILLSFFMISIPVAEAKIKSNFLKQRLIDLQQGSRSGELTKREFTILRRELRSYRQTLRDFNANQKLSRRERKKLKKLEALINRQFYIALNNRETTRGAKGNRSSNRKFRNQRGSYNNGPICRPVSRRSYLAFR